MSLETGAVEAWCDPSNIKSMSSDALVGWRALAQLVMDDATWKSQYQARRKSSRYGTQGSRIAKRIARNAYYQKHKERICAKLRAERAARASK